MLTCPICFSALTRNNSVFQCEHAHSFDIAKEGYVNLVTHKLAATVGDTKEMLHARRRFLDAGFYQPLSDVLNEYAVACLSMLQEQHKPAFLDIGCGEGYYIGRMQTHLLRFLSNVHGHYWGLDISKEAIRMAARRFNAMRFVVADVNTHLVFANESLHILLNVFAPRNIAEFARVLVPDGFVIVAIPGSRHLRRLREQLSLLNIQENKPEYVKAQFAPYFELLTTSTLHYCVRLTREEARQLVTMTPNYWHYREPEDVAVAREETVVSVEFMCMLFRKRELQPA